MTLKVSALASGAILLDGVPVELAQLNAAMEAAKNEDGAVWYYREAAAQDPPPQAMKVMELVVKHKLPVRLSTKPDFSDSIDMQSNVEGAFVAVRKFARGQRGVVIMRSNGGPAVMPAPPPTPQLQQMASKLAAIIPADRQRTIAVLADTSFAARPNVSPLEANQAIPFFGMLIGFAFLGHAVMVIQAAPALLEAGCREADFLLLDSAIVEKLPPDFVQRASAVMRNANIAIHNRQTHQLGIVRNAAGSPGAATFPN